MLLAPAMAVASGHADARGDRPIDRHRPGSGITRRRSWERAVADVDLTQQPAAAVWTGSETLFFGGSDRATRTRADPNDPGDTGYLAFRSTVAAYTPTGDAVRTCTGPPLDEPRREVG